jgi:peptidyl-prolyl cis-trans isomerase C
LNGNEKPYPKPTFTSFCRGGITLASLATLVSISAACTQRRSESQTIPVTLRAVVATIDGQPITAWDLVSDVANRSPYYRLQFRSPEGQKALLDTLIRFEVMAKEAKDHGYDKDPDVVRTHKQQMINKLVQNESHSATDQASEAALQQYYANHPADFVQSERVRFSQIVIKDRARAKVAASAAAALPLNDIQGFRALVIRFSEDRVTKAKGGDAGTFDRSATTLPKVVLDAAFNLTPTSPVSASIETERGFYILQLVAKIPASTRPLSEVRNDIAYRLSGDLAAKRMDAWSTNVHARHAVQIFPDRLKGLDLTADLRQTTPAGTTPQH